MFFTVYCQFDYIYCLPLKLLFLFWGMPPKRKEPRRLVRQGSFCFLLYMYIYTRALLPYDCLSCNGCHHQYVFVNIVFIVSFFILYGAKPVQNPMYNKMNLFISYAEVQPVFVFATNVGILFKSPK